MCLNPNQSRVCEVTLVCGFPCSGKSFWIQSNVKTSPTLEVFDLKDLRTIGRVKRHLSAAFYEQKDAVVEASLTSSRDQIRFAEFVIMSGHRIKAVWIETDLELCLSRNRRRDLKDRVRPRLIKEAFASGGKPDTFDGFAEVKIVKST